MSRDLRRPDAAGGRSTCPLAKGAHQSCIWAPGCPIGPRGWRAGRGGRRRSRTLAADYRRLNAMVVGQPGRRDGQGGRHSAQPAPAVAHRAPTARPGHPRLAVCPRTSASARSSCATGSTVGGCSCCGRDRDAVRTRSTRPSASGWRRGVDRHDVVLGVREGSGRPGREPDTQLFMPTGAWGLSDAAGARLLGRAPGRRCRGHGRCGRGGRLPADRPTPARTSCPTRARRTSRSATTRPSVPCRARSCTVVRRARPPLCDSVFEPPDAEHGRWRTAARSTSPSPTPTTCPGWRLVERLRRQYVDG